MDYLLHLLLLIGFYTLLSQSLNLSAGAGLVSLAHACFYGIGAYTAAVMATRFGVSFWLALPLAILISGVIALAVSVIALRTVDDYFIICTLGIQVIFFSVVNNWMELTRGPLGIAGISGITILGYEVGDKSAFLLLTLLFASLVWVLMRNMTRSGFGKILLALSEDEVYTSSIGKNVFRAKVISFTLSASLAAIPGALYAHYVSYIDPTSFTVQESVFILSIVIIGGTGSLAGSFMAAAFLVLLPEALRFAGLPDAIAADLRQVIYGLILVIVMMTGRKA